MAVDRIISPSDCVKVDWRAGLPVLRSARVTARELEKSDAPALHRIASEPEVTRFSWPAPPDVKAVEGFITWAHRERLEGRYICFGIVSNATGALAGLFELRRIQPDFFRAETGFFLGTAFWGNGHFDEAARLVFGFAADVVGAYRIEARTAVQNLRGNAALAKSGFRHEGVLRDAFLHEGRFEDQNLWAISYRRLQS